MSPSRRAFLMAGLGAAASLRCGRGRDLASPSPVESAPGGTDVRLNEDLSGRALFPPDNWWNRNVTDAPVDRDSGAILRFIGLDRALHPDFGRPPYGIPYLTVSRSQPRVPVRFVAYGDESDEGDPGYPIPEEAKTRAGYIEGGAAGGGADGDRHLLVVDRDRFVLYETWATRWNASESVWEAGSGAVYDLRRNDRRPEGWTSADAAGLAILPGLVRFDEAMGEEEIRHAFRVTVRATNGYVWPASHEAGGTAGAPPMGTRLRLKPELDLSRFPPGHQRIFRAIQHRGLIVADNGSDLFVTGTMDPRWNNDELNSSFRALRARDFEVLELGWR